MTLLHTRTGATGISHPDFGDFEVSPEGTIEVPDPLAKELLGHRVDGVEQWETDIDHRSRLLREERERRQDPATLLAEVEKLTGSPAAPPAPSGSEPFDPDSLDEAELERLLAERRAAAGKPPLVPEQQATAAEPTLSETENENPEEGVTERGSGTPLPGADSGDANAEHGTVNPDGTPAELKPEHDLEQSGPTAPVPLAETGDGALQEAAAVTVTEDEAARRQFAEKVAASEKRIGIVAEALVANDYDTLQVPELQALSSERGLGTEGPKSDLISRLQEQDAGRASQPQQ